MAARAMLLFLLILTGMAALFASYNILTTMTMTSLQRSPESSTLSFGIDPIESDINMVAGLFLGTVTESHHGMEKKKSESILLQEKPIIKEPINEEEKEKKKKKRLFHVALTSSDSPYNRWQCRIMYYWYKQFREKAGSEMGGFTRILHSGKPDDLMNEIPTAVVEELPPGMDQVKI